METPDEWLMDCLGGCGRTIDANELICDDCFAASKRDNGRQCEALDISNP